MSGTQAQTVFAATPAANLTVVADLQDTDTVVIQRGGNLLQAPQGVAFGAYLPLGGGSIAGAVSWSGTPTEPAHLTPKAYVDQQVASTMQSNSQSAALAVAAKVDAQNAALASANSATTAINAQKDNAGGVAALSASNNLMLNSKEVMGVDANGNLIIVLPIPTSDPGVKGACYWNGGILTLSSVS